MSQMRYAAIFLCWQVLFAVSSMAAPHLYRTDRILVQPRSRADLGRLANLHGREKAGVLRSFPALGHLQVVRVPPGHSVGSLIERYQRSGLVQFAEPDYIVQMTATFPDDPKFRDGTLWGLHNTGQSGGTADADIDAPEGWDTITSASNVVVAVLDTGIRATHEDLATNMWSNPLDGSHGWNAVAGTNDVTDDNGHGTLVAGIIGAAGNNGKGITGVAWRVQLMACKCLDATGQGSDSDVIESIDFARTNGARIINASLDTTEYSQALSNAIAAARDAGIIFVASSGNNAADNDISPRYPAGYDLDNIVTTTYTTRSNTLGRVANYGATSVDLAAPGAAVYSTFFANDSSYLGGNFMEGTSMAAAYVSGTLALMLTRFPDLNYRETISRLMGTVDHLPALAGKCVSGGRINLWRALTEPFQLQVLSQAGSGVRVGLAAAPNKSYAIEASSDLRAWTAIFTNTTSASGNLEFSDTLPASTHYRFYRAILNP